MSEHFEHLWEKAEKISEEMYDNTNLEVNDVISEIQDNLLFLRRANKNKDTIELSNIIGKILFNITYISKKCDINTYAVLKEHMEDVQIEMLDIELDNSAD